MTNANTEMKQCSKCAKLLPTTEFFKCSQTKIGILPNCKSCFKEYHSSYYQANKERLNELSRLNRQRIKRLNNLWVLNYLKTHGCVDCGEMDPIVLDFDHVRGDKSNSISDMVRNTNSIKSIEKEIAKCEVRCSNCHRRKTAKEANWYSYIDFETMTIKPD